MSCSLVFLAHFEDDGLASYIIMVWMWVTHSLNTDVKSYIIIWLSGTHSGLLGEVTEMQLIAEYQEAAVQNRHKELHFICGADVTIDDQLSRLHSLHTHTQNFFFKVKNKQTRKLTCWHAKLLKSYVVQTDFFFFFWGGINPDMDSFMSFIKKKKKNNCMASATCTHNQI